jgi:hypothetical protein
MLTNDVSLIHDTQNSAEYYDSPRLRAMQIESINKGILTGLLLIYLDIYYFKVDQILSY